MPSVAFCNLDEAYGSNIDAKKERQKQKIRNFEQSQEYQTQMMNQEQMNQEQMNQAQMNQAQMNQAQMNQAQMMSMQNPQTGLQGVQNLPTFTNAENCMNRNNVFQNQIAQNTFGIPYNPLNLPDVNFPNGNLNATAFNQPYLYQFYPSYNQFMNPYNVLPVSPQQNVWPPQQWVINPMGPMAYQNTDPMVRNYQYYSGRPDETGGPVRIEHFGSQMESMFSSEKTLQYILIVLVLILFVQIIELGLKIKA